jgi:streptomycin 6-kinase
VAGREWQASSIKIPDGLQAEVRRRDPGADAWLTELPAIWRQMSAGWGLSIAGEPSIGSVSLVVPVRRSNGLAALKLISPAIDASREAAALMAFDGHGAVRLLDADLTRQALLLEWLEGPTLAAEPDIAEAISTAGALARQLACTPAPDGAPTLRGDASGWIELLHQQHSMALHRGSAAPEDLFALVVTIVHELGNDTTTTLTHGDLSLSNIMRASPGRWVAIDPYFIAGTVANEAHTVMRSQLPALLATANPSALLRDWTAGFSDAAGVDVDQAQRISLARYLASYYWEAENGGDPGSVENLRLGLFLTADQV